MPRELVLANRYLTSHSIRQSLIVAVFGSGGREIEMLHERSSM
jgi:hypothetical protein